MIYHDIVEEDIINLVYIYLFMTLTNVKNLISALKHKASNLTLGKINHAKKFGEKRKMIILLRIVIEQACVVWGEGEGGL